MVVYHDRNLIINYIPRNVSDVDLSSLFSTVGTIKTCRIIRDRNSGSSFGFGFCEYEDAESAHRAIARFNGYRIADKVLKVSLAKLQGRLCQSSNLYVKNFPLSLTEEQLSSEFERFGKVLQCRILRDRESDASKGSAYVLFENRSNAECAKKALDGAPWPGSTENSVLAIKFATPPYRQPSNNAPQNKSIPTRKVDHTLSSFQGVNYGDQLAAQILALQSRGGFGCESLLTTSNQPCLQDPMYLSQGSGMLGSVPPSGLAMQGQGNPCNILWPSEYVVSDGRPAITAPLQMASAYAPPYYISQYPWVMNQWSSLPSTISTGATSSYPGILEGFTNAVHGCPVFTGLSPVFSQPFNLNGTQHGAMRTVHGEANNKRSKAQKSDKASTSVYVYNIGNLMTNKELCDLFGRFGSISCVSIPRDPKTNYARNFGFVTFENFKSAANAVASMNGGLHAGRRLQVSFRKPKPVSAKPSCVLSSKLAENGNENESESLDDPSLSDKSKDMVNMQNDKELDKTCENVMGELKGLKLNDNSGELETKTSSKITKEV
ncbi:ELAV protein 2 [Fasciolopsis buskii]|uniref:ELAV protein 2 n=1 Tax=Fasciolopsis buskii TaxID=27845 RepID=A0A8E0RY29_9TREM|nr:ELAV protein 2 [Fasciolopsis buski]